MRNTIENFGSKNLLWERVPLDRNLSASECSVMPRAQNTSLRGCKLTTRHTMNIGRREFQACCLSPTEKFRGPPTHTLCCALIMKIHGKPLGRTVNYGASPAS